MALRSEAQPVASKRDTDWILAMGAALGMDSGFSIPIVPEVEPFRQLFAALRASPPPQPAPEVGALVNTLNAWADATEAGTCVLDRLDQATELRQAASALSARRVSEEEVELAAFWANMPDDALDRINIVGLKKLARAVLRIAGEDHGR